MVAVEQLKKKKGRLGARVEARVTPDIKLLLKRAADVQGCTVSDFLISSAVAKAQETILAHDFMLLSQHGIEQFLAAIDNPPSFDEKLHEAHQWNRQHVEVTW